MRKLAQMAKWWRSIRCNEPHRNGRRRHSAAEGYPSFLVAELEPRRVLDAAPVIAPQSFDINANAANNSSVGVVIASDPDPGDVLNYSITAGNTGGTFAINATTGEIQVLDNTLVGSTPTFALTVEVTDTTNKTASATITVNVLLPPVVDNQSFIVPEDSAADTPVGTVVASDPNLDPLTYSITGGNNGNAFKIDANTGALAVNNAAQVNTPSTFTLTVQVSDPGGLSDTAQITIVVNGAPTDISLSNSSLLENTNGAVVGNLSATDPNPGDTFSYTVDDTRFEVVGAQLKLKAGETVDRDAATTINVTITVTDAGGATFNKLFVLSVTDINEAPSFTKGADQTVNEDAGPQSVTNWATNISAGGTSEAGQILTFEVTDNTNAALFSAGPAISSTGTLTYTTTANAHGTATITIRLKDNGGTANGGVDTSATQTFTITVNPVNDAPSFTKGADQVVNEDSGAHSVVGWATNISPGPADETGQTVQFEVTDNTNAALFSVGPAIAADGTLSYTLAADAFGIATVTIRLVDDGGTANGGVNASGTQSFTITVNPVNDAPSFTKGADQTVAEDAGPQSVSNWATNISVGPANEASQTPTFEVINNTNPGLFSAGPAISADGTLTYTPTANANGTATITIRITDDGGTANGGVDASATQSFIITVSAVNDAPTLGNGTLASVPEDSTNPPGQTIGTIFAGQFADIDAGASFSGIAVVGNSADSVTQGVWQYSTTGGLTWFDIGAVNDGANALALNTSTLVRFLPVADFNGAPAPLVVRGMDNTYSGGFSSTLVVELRVNVDTTISGGTTAIAGATANLATTITPVNDAPTLGNGTLAAVLEDTANPAGQTVSTIFAGQFADIDAGSSLSGIAVVGNTANPLTQGVWQYSTNGGGNWFDIGAVDDNTGALALSSSTRIRFVPVANYFGTPTGLTVRGLDNTYAGGFSSTAGAETRVTINTSSPGGTTPIAAATASLSTSVTPVNDVPAFTKGADQVVNEDAGPQTVLNWATGISAGPINEAGQVLTFIVTNNTNAALFSAGPSISADGTLTFTTAQDASGVATITIRIHDDGGTDNGGVDSSATQSFTITVNSINDAPSLANGSLAAVNEDTLAPPGQTIAVIFAGKFADVDPGDTLAGVAFIGNGANVLTEGRWQYSTNNGINWFDVGSVNDGPGALVVNPATLVRFVPAPDYFGTPTPLILRALDSTYVGSFSTTNGFQVRVNVNAALHGGETAIAGIATQLGTFIDPVNDPPTFSIDSPLVVNPVSPQPVPINNPLPGPLNESSQTLSWQAVSSDTEVFPHPTVVPTGDGGYQLSFFPAPFRNGTVLITVTATDSEGLSVAQVVTVDLVVGQVPPPNLAFEARPSLLVVPTRDQEFFVQFSAPPVPLAQPPLDASSATGDTGSAGQRVIEVYVVDPATGEVTERLPFELPSENLEQLNALFRDLPDDRYRVMLKLEDGTRRLVREVLVRDGKPFDPGDERDQFVEPIPVEAADERAPENSPSAPPGNENLPLQPPLNTSPAEEASAASDNANTVAWSSLAPALLVALASQQNASARRQRLTSTLEELGKRPWLRHLLGKQSPRK
jgi:hypothetical protein